MDKKKIDIFNADIHTEGLSSRAGEVDVIFLAKEKKHIYYADENGEVDKVLLEFIMNYDNHCPITDKSQLLNAEKDIFRKTKVSKNYFTIKIDTNQHRQIIPNELPTDAFQLAEPDKEQWEILVEEGIIYLLLLKPLSGAIKDNPQPTFISTEGQISNTSTNKILGFSIEINNFYLITNTDDESMKTGDIKLKINYSTQIGTHNRPFDKSLEGNDRIFYKFEDMKIIPLYPVVRAMSSHSPTIATRGLNDTKPNRAGILVNNNKENTLVIQLVNVSNKPIVFDDDSQWVLDIPNDSNAPYSVTHQENGFEYLVSIKAPNQNAQQISCPDTGHQFSIDLTNSKTIVPYGYLEIIINNFTTDLSPRTSFIKFAFTNAQNFKDNFILIPVIIQPMTMEDRTVIIAANDRKLEMTGSDLKLKNSEDQTKLELVGNDTSGTLRVFNKEGSLGTHLSSSFLGLYDQGEIKALMLASNRHGQQYLYGNNSKVNIALIGDANHGAIQLNYQGNKRILIQAKNTNGQALLFNEEKKEIVNIGGNQNYGTIDLLYQGNSRTSLGNGNITLYKSNGYPNIILRDDAKESGSIDFYLGTLPKAKMYADLEGAKIAVSKKNNGVYVTKKIL
jgi:hypothetical protein